ncbi:MAG: hypothetical protein ACFBZ8_12880 [Opitutales bacterium]
MLLSLGLGHPLCAIAPTVVSIVPSTTTPAAGASVDLTVTFSEPVLNVTIDDFLTVRPVIVDTVLVDLRNPSLDQTTYLITLFAATESTSSELVSVRLRTTTDIIDVDEALGLVPGAFSPDITFLQFNPRRLFSAPSPDEFFDPANWVPIDVPDTPLEDAVIENGQLAQALSGPGVPSTLRVKSLVAGSADGNGSVLFDGITLEVFEGSTSIGSQQLISAPFTSADRAGGLTVRNAPLLELSPSVSVGNGLLFDVPSGNYGSFGRLIVRDVATVRIDEKPGTSFPTSGQRLDAASVFSFGTLGDPQLNLTAELIFEDIDTFDFGEGSSGLLLAASSQLAPPTGFAASLRQSLTAEFTRIHDLEVGQITIGENDSFFPSNLMNVSATFEDVTVDTNVLLIGRHELRDGNTLNADIDVSFTDTRILALDSSGGGFVLAGLIDNTNDSATSQATTNLTFVRSQLFTPLFTVGLFSPVDNSTFEIAPDPSIQGTYASHLTLNSSFIQAVDFEIGGTSTLTFHLDGETPVSLTNLGQPATYARIETLDARLAGSIEVDFDFVPPGPGPLGVGTTFTDIDLVTTTSSTALDDTTATLGAVELPANVFITGFGVVNEGGVDILRLTYTTTFSPYELWTGARGVPGGLTSIDQDLNQDGRLNGEHFAFDTNPSGDGTTEGKFRRALIEVPGRSGEYFSLTFPVRKNAIFAADTAVNPATASGDEIDYTVRGRRDLNSTSPADTIAVFELKPALDDGLPALGSYSGISEPDWTYRTFVLDESVATTPEGFIVVEATRVAP